MTFLEYLKKHYPNSNNQDDVTVVLVCRAAEEYAEYKLGKYAEYKLGLLTHVLPEESVLWKPNHDMFLFYKCHEDFEDEKEYTSQGSTESFQDFIYKTIDKLQKEEAEKGEDYPTVTIDNAIFSNGV